MTEESKASKYNRLQKSQHQEIIEKYKTGRYTGNKLDKEYNFSSGVCISLLRKYGIKIVNAPSLTKRIYSLNQHYFDEIDTKEKAYFLGFLYADGYNNEKQNIVRIAINKIDEYLLVKFNELLEHNKPIYKEKKPRTTKPDEHTVISVLSITDRNISERLKKHGMFQKKSLTLKFPSFLVSEPDLLKSFILGYYDGDGGLSSAFQGKHECFIARITSSKFFCYSLRRVLKQILNINFQVYKRNTPSNMTYSIVVKGNQGVYKFLDWLYKDEPLFLTRKYDRFLRLIEIRDKQEKNKIEFNGERKTMTEWGEKFGLSYSVIRGRLKTGWDMERISKTPKQKK